MATKSNKYTTHFKCKKKCFYLSCQKKNSNKNIESMGIFFFYTIIKKHIANNHRVVPKSLFNHKTVNRTWQGIRGDIEHHGTVVINNDLRVRNHCDVHRVHRGIHLGYRNRCYVRIHCILVGRNHCIRNHRCILRKKLVIFNKVYTIYSVWMILSSEEWLSNFENFKMTFMLWQKMYLIHHLKRTVPILNDLLRTCGR